MIMISNTAAFSESANGPSPLRSLADSLSKSSQTINKASSSSRFPETSSKSVGYWLLGSAASVFGIVVFGGLTRLTESGLSITEWKPVTGSLFLSPLRIGRVNLNYIEHRQNLNS
ncbi:hypothetical protein DID88_004542 [Monilinia fructigena]|uniref:Uncharacterized protein n=1 Tax=Monilinia fructigena TaxID=38457 RepID=A0A395IWH2_9HELO|nr:hypothetical protein DID88_004542 [Monilinia fructigena]